MDNPNDVLISGSTATWDMGQVQGEVSGTYMGTFQFRCFLTPTQTLAASREYRELLGPQLMLAPEFEGQLAYALVQTKHRILKAPPFWTAPTQNGELPGNIPDLNVILLVLDAAIVAETKYRESKAKERDEALESAIKASEAKLENDSEDEED